MCFAVVLPCFGGSVPCATIVYAKLFVTIKAEIDFFHNRFITSRFYFNGYCLVDRFPIVRMRLICDSYTAG